MKLKINDLIIELPKGAVITLSSDEEDENPEGLLTDHEIFRDWAIETIKKLTAIKE